MIYVYVLKFLASCYFSVDDERVTEQGQLDRAVGYWTEQEAHSLFRVSKG
jgi:predicted ATP-dependent Lon-type protease